MNTADLNRRLESMIRLGTIAEVDYDVRKLRVKTGELLTEWLPWPAEIGRNFIRWRPLRVGTQVVLASPSGDPAQAVVVGMLYTQAIDRPSADPDIDLIQFDDGSFIKHNHAEQTFHIHCSGTITMSYEHLYLKGPVTQTGGDMTSDGISAQHHKHTGVMPGPALTGEPE